MENAGRNAADAIEAFLGEIGGKSVAVICGSGNNAGDGFVITRHLDLRGVSVTAYLIAPPDKLSGDARINFNILRNFGLDVRLVVSDALACMGEQLKTFDLLVDALGGTGIKGRLKGDLAVAVEQVNSSGKPVVAVDIPTVLDCDTGEAPGPTVKADLTITFVAEKKGFENPASSAYKGEVEIADIGVSPQRVLSLMQDSRG
jgi:NAD(P)H-hydrate epimerase